MSLPAMSQPRRRSLLEFGITASAAVLPLMLAVLWLVGWLHPPGHGGGSRLELAMPDRHVSVRQIAALKLFEQAVRPRSELGLELPLPSDQKPRPDQGPAKTTAKATTSASARTTAATATSSTTPTSLPSPDADTVLAAVPGCARDWRAADIAAQLIAADTALARFSSRVNPRVAQPVGLDAARWLSLAQAQLTQAIEAPQYPGRSFRLSCGDLAAALSALAREDMRLLEALSWRGSVGPAVLARWAPQQQLEVGLQQVMRRNPWSGLAGCIFLGRQDGANNGLTPNDSVPGLPSHYIGSGPSSRACREPGMLTVAASAKQPDAAVAAPTLAAVATPAVLKATFTPPQALAGEPGLEEPPDSGRWSVPPSLPVLLEPLEALRQPSRPLYRLLTDGGLAGPQRITLDGHAVDLGFSLQLTIDPTLQALAQKTAACYSGRQDICRALGLHRAEDGNQAIGHALLEGAMVRMAAVAVIDVASGRIEALAGAMSPCARQEVDGPGRDPRCDTRLPYPLRYRPDALLNPAVYHDAMPASTIKPIMAAAFLDDSDSGRRTLAAERAAMGRGGSPARESLRGQLMRSDSARFLDRMFCIDSSGGAHCNRPWDVQATARSLGWNAGCGGGTAGPSTASTATRPNPTTTAATSTASTAATTASTPDCGRHDLLFGRSVEAPADPLAPRPLANRVAFGRLMTEPAGARLGAAMHLRPPTDLSAAILRRCAAGADGRRGSDDDWEKCSGGAVVDVIAEGWGQGHARASALGVAGMIARLAAAANGQPAQRPPHLVEGVRALPGSATPLLVAWAPEAVQPLHLSQPAAEVILGGMAYSHREGTARSACEQVFDAKRCRDIGWVAGKTGTPSFPSDGISLDELVAMCRPKAATPSQRTSVKAGITVKNSVSDEPLPAACSTLRPYKWYAAAYRADGSNQGPWTKAIAVLTERNWVRATGMVHGAGDRGPNPAAEIALQLIGRQVGAFSAANPPSAGAAALAARQLGAAAVLVPAATR